MTAGPPNIGCTPFESAPNPGGARLPSPLCLLIQRIKSVYTRVRTKAEHLLPSPPPGTTGAPMNSLVPNPSEISAAPRERALPPVPFGPAPLIEGEDAGAY